MPAISTCPNCKEPKLLHHVCTECGFYRGKEVLKREEVQEG
jgi:large subunit ribosomal protein L32